MSARIEVSLWLINQKNLNAQAPRFWILSCFQIFFAALLLLGVRSEDSSTRRYRVQSWLPYCTHRSLCFRWKGSGRSAKAQSNLSSWKFRYTDDTHLMVSFDLSEISRSFSFPSLLSFYLWPRGLRRYYVWTNPSFAEGSIDSILSNDLHLLREMTTSVHRISYRPPLPHLGQGSLLSPENHSDQRCRPTKNLVRMTYSILPFTPLT